MKKRSGLTLDQHKELAEKLYKIRNELVKLLPMVINAYPYLNSPRIRQALRGIDKLRSDLDGRLFGDCPQEADIHIYYPGH